MSAAVLSAPVMVQVDDPADPLLADYRSLSDAELRVRYEGRSGVFIAEGPNVVRALLSSAYETRSILVTPGQCDALGGALGTATAPVYVASQRVMDTVAGFHLHRGALACGVRRDPASLDEVLSGARVVALLERLNDHENLGALYRNARALGVDAVLLCEECCDPLYRRCVRVSMGHVLHVATARVGPAYDAVTDLVDRGFTTVALTPGAAAEPVSVLRDLEPDQCVAVVVGAEGPGLRDVTMAAADRRVRIPMAPGVDSLNVATAAAIAFHELQGGP